MTEPLLWEKLRPFGGYGKLCVFSMSKRYRISSVLRTLASLSLLSSGGVCFGQLKFKLQTEEVVEARLRHFGGSDIQREAELKKLFLEAGCPAEGIQEQTVKSKQPPNLVCVLPGATDEVIVVGAHFDHVDRGDGVVDNWSGASLLPSLLFSVRQEPRHHTYVFIGFMGEEQHLVGSEYYVKHLSEEQRKRIKAMINMDTLGLGTTEVWVTHADKALVGVLAAVAKSMQIPIQAMNVDNVGTTDSEAFARLHVPRMTIHTLTAETLPILHSPKDRLDKIRMGDYYDTYRLVAGDLIYLDQYLTQQNAQPASTPATIP